MSFKVSDLAAHVGKLSAFLGDATLAAGKNLDAEISLDACGPVRDSARALLDYVGAGDDDLDAREALEGKHERSIDSKRAADARRRMAFDRHSLNDIFSTLSERDDASRASGSHDINSIFGG